MKTKPIKENGVRTIASMHTIPKDKSRMDTLPSGDDPEWAGTYI